MPFFESGLLAKLLDHATQARRLFSNPQKPERERMVVRAFLRSIGVAFDDSEITPSREEPVDTRFRTAEFQIMEIVGTRRRGLDWRRREDKYRNAQGIADVIDPYTPSQPLSLDDTGRLLADRLARKAARYGAETCSALDALVYVDLHGRHLWPLMWFRRRADRNNDICSVEVDKTPRFVRAIGHNDRIVPAAPHREAQARRLPKRLFVA
jgi:Putative endonuclease, protein of unknown function (DUF1780)